MSKGADSPTIRAGTSVEEVQPLLSTTRPPIRPGRTRARRSKAAQALKHFLCTSARALAWSRQDSCLATTNYSVSRQTTKVWDASSTMCPKSQPSCSSCRVQTTLFVKSCFTDLRGGFRFASSRFLPAMMLNVRHPSEDSVAWASHLTCTIPRPPDFRNEALPRLSEVAFGRIIILKVIGLGHEISKGGDTATRSLPCSFRASTVQLTRKAPLAVLCDRLRVWGCGTDGVWVETAAGAAAVAGGAPKAGGTRCSSTWLGHAPEGGPSVGNHSTTAALPGIPAGASSIGTWTGIIMNGDASKPPG
mmetsp:Transcript_6709/g.18415  ORF Transcript_6709/g.18415 Transcript_6709/m.18415 type:complete len:304 (-) Transcript_6709:613-1524(-)